MNIKALLAESHLNSDNTIVVGSGVLQALDLRKSNKVEVVVSDQIYKKCIDNNSLESGLVVSTVWNVADNQWAFDELLDDSMVIDGIRYVTVEFLCNVITNRLLSGEFHQKDKDDIVLMNNYLDQQGTQKCSCDC